MEKLVTTLILDRRYNPTVWVSNPDALHWVDSCGSRSVWFWNPEGDDYSTATDLPQDEFEKIAAHVRNVQAHGHDVSICLRREDPGLGIYIPEIDDPVRNAGCIPDGCIVNPNYPDLPV